MASLIASGVDFRIQGKSVVYAGFVYFDNPDDEDDTPRLMFHNVTGVQKEYGDGTLVNPEYVALAEEFLAEALKKAGKVLAPADAND